MKTKSKKSVSFLNAVTILERCFNEDYNNHIFFNKICRQSELTRHLDILVELT